MSLSQNYFLWKPNSGLESHVSGREWSVPFFSCSVLDFLPMKIRKRRLQMESLTLSADLEKAPWEFVLVMQSGADWQASHLPSYCFNFRLQRCPVLCSKHFIKNLWGGKSGLCGPVWFHYPWHSTQTEQGRRRLEMAVCGAGVKQRPLEPSSTDHRCSSLLGDLSRNHESPYITKCILLSH